MLFRRRLLHRLLTLIVILLIATTASAKIREQEHNSDISRLVKGHSTDRILCIDGMKVFQTIAFGPATAMAPRSLIFNSTKRSREKSSRRPVPTNVRIQNNKTG